ncbi:holo-[acyl-carrier-protein] synthase [Heyndrickxia sporothermodurans]|nr:holo-[acyl-carrier-protein] synthase [Heyndrickxia sporothermodurans]
MIKGIGLDIIEIERIHQLRIRQQRFPEKILSEKELESYKGIKESRKSEYLAGRFAAKEAFSKALGTGIGKELSLQEMVIMVDDRGKPYFKKPIEKGVHLSITHSKQYAAAQVVIESV